MPTTADLLTPPPVETPKAERKDPNNLTLKQRISLMQWCEENRAQCQTDTDSALAAAASETLGFAVTPGNLTGMRRELAITKNKPAPTPADIDLAALQKKVEEHDLQLAPLQGQSIPALIDLLRQQILDLETRLKSLEASND